MESLMKRESPEHNSKPQNRSGEDQTVERLSAWEGKVVQIEFETYEDNLPGKLVKQVRHLLDVIDDAGPPVAAGALERLGLGDLLGGIDERHLHNLRGGLPVRRFHVDLGAEFSQLDRQPRVPDVLLQPG